jgi:hypothetical protein
MPAEDLHIRKAFRYTPLTNPEHIRLLIVLPGTINDDIHCFMVHGDPKNLDPVLPPQLPHGYIALSYVWGRKDLPKSHMKIANWQPDKTAMGHEFSDMLITPTLESALRDLRSEVENSVIWADAVCINQDDVQERNGEVLKMGNIYSQATTVRVCLGLPLERFRRQGVQYQHYKASIRAAFSWFQTCSITMVYTRPSEIAWSGILYLYAHPWFRRIWVLQEVTLATGDVKISCEQMMIEFNAVMRACLFIRDLLLKEERFDFSPDAIHIWYFDEVYRFLQGRRVLNDPIPDKIVQTLSRTSGHLCATMEKDRLYGILGMIGDVKGVPALAPRYNLSDDKVFEDLARYLIFFTGTVVILDSWEESTVRGKSWVPTWEHRRTFPYPSLTRARQTTRLRFSDCGTRLHVNASKCGKILKIKHLHPGLFRQEESARQCLQELEAARKEVDANLSGSNLEPGEDLADLIIQEAPAAEKATFMEYYRAFIGHSTRRPNSRNNAKPLLELLVQLFTSSHVTFFVTTENYIGLCASSAQAEDFVEEGDFVYWLPGCRGGPLAFRPEEGGLRIVGRCFLHQHRVLTEDEHYEFLRKGKWEDIVIV